MRRPRITIEANDGPLFAEAVRTALDQLGIVYDLVSVTRTNAARSPRGILRAAADAWSQGEWADQPWVPDVVQQRLASSNYFGDWLRKRADGQDEVEGHVVVSADLVDFVELAKLKPWQADRLFYWYDNVRSQHGGG